MRNTIIPALCALALLALAAADAAPAAAQTVERVPATVLLVDRADADEPFTIVRRPDASPHDVIVLGPQANHRVLSAAIEDLLASRTVLGDTASRAVLIRVRRPTGAQGERRLIPWAERVMRDLRTAEPREVAGVGTGRAVQIWLPPRGQGSVDP